VRMSTRPSALTGLLLALLLVSPLAGPAAVSGSPGDGTGIDLSAPPGPTGVASLDVEIATDTGRFPARVWLPATGDEHPGSGLPVVAPGRHPVIVFGHGYLGRVEWYWSTLHHLATWGFIVVAPMSGLELVPDHDAFVEDLRRVLDWLEAEDEAPGGWLEGHVLRGAYGASGHSMGGGASVVAAARDERFAAVANLAAAELRLGAVESLAGLEAPLLLVAAGEDRFTPVAVHQRPMFEAKETGPVQLRVIEGGSHCGFLDARPFPVICDQASIAEESQRAIARRLLTGWFLYWLAGREDLAGDAWPSDAEPGVSLEVRGRLPADAATLAGRAR
jgi:predicted dienelactone hydrolase